MVREDVLARMLQAGEILDVSNPLYLQAEAVSSKSRILDKPPRTIVLRKLDDSKGFGAAAEFIDMYTSFKRSMNLEVAKIQMGTAVRFCDPEVFYALHCLGLFSRHCVAERAQAAAELFKLIMTTPGEVLSVALIYERLKAFKRNDYYTKQFVMALRACLFMQKEAILLWITLASDHTYYKEASKLGARLIDNQDWNEKELKQFLNAKWAEAKEDKEFIKQLYKPMCNKWMTAMIYALKDEHPEVLKTSGNSDGFL